MDATLQREATVPGGERESNGARHAGPSPAAPEPYASTGHVPLPLVGLEARSEEPVLPAGMPSQAQAQEQLVRCSVRGAGDIAYHPVKLWHRVHFCRFVEQVTDRELVGFFRGIMGDLAAKGVHDFHLKIDGFTQVFSVAVKYGEAYDGPPHVPVETCIACQPEAEIFPGMTSRETYLTEYDSRHMRASMDAQGRSAFIVTPLRHVESLDELEDREVAELFRTAASLLAREKLPLSRMVLNHGTYRNLPHLHLKIFIPQRPFDSARKRWGPERTAAFEKLVMSRPAKSSSVCKFFIRTGSCRFGEACRNLHTTTGGK